MKNMYKKIIIIFTILMLLFCINSRVYAWSEIMKDGKDFLNAADSSKANINEGEMKSSLQEASGYLFNLLLTVGIVVAVIVASVLGIQFIIGGAEGQAKVKEMLVPFVVGCIVVFGAFAIWKVALTIGKKLETASIIEINDVRIAKIDENIQAF